MGNEWWLKIRMPFMESPVIEFRIVMGQVRKPGNVIQYDGV
jgi:hypothetical protein